MSRFIKSPARPIAVQAIGVFTSAGISVSTALGSARLGLKFFEELPWNDPAGVPVVGGRTPLDLTATTGVERLVTMATLALRECGVEPNQPPAPLLLCLPEPLGLRFVPAGALHITCEQAGAGIDPRLSRAFATGRAGVFEALEEAGRLLSSRSARTVYLGGVDSLVDREPFTRLLRAGRIKTSTTDGLIPGEGATFLRLGLDAEPGTLALIAGIGRSDEPRTRDADEPNVGAGMAEAARAALAAAALDSAEIGAVVHDAGGDRFGFREVAMAMTRLGSRSDPAPQVLATASCAGELGAAYGPFALAMASFFSHRNVITGPGALVLGGSESTARGAAVVVAPPVQRPARR